MTKLQLIDAAGQIIQGPLFLGEEYRLQVKIMPPQGGPYNYTAIAVEHHPTPARDRKTEWDRIGVTLTNENGKSDVIAVNRLSPLSAADGEATTVFTIKAGKTGNGRLLVNLYDDAVFVDKFSLQVSVIDRPAAREAMHPARYEL